MSEGDIVAGDSLSINVDTQTDGSIGRLRVGDVINNSDGYYHYTQGNEYTAFEPMSFSPTDEVINSNININVKKIKNGMLISSGYERSIEDHIYCKNLSELSVEVEKIVKKQFGLESEESV